jgi:hypothetical protein
MIVSAEWGKQAADDDITFIVGAGNQSTICGAITPMTVLGADDGDSPTGGQDDRPESTQRPSTTAS